MSVSHALIEQLFASTTSEDYDKARAVLVEAANKHPEQWLPDLDAAWDAAGEEFDKAYKAYAEAFQFVTLAEAGKVDASNLSALKANAYDRVRRVWRAESLKRDLHELRTSIWKVSS